MNDLQYLEDNCDSFKEEFILDDSILKEFVVGNKAHNTATKKTKSAFFILFIALNYININKDLTFYCIALKVCLHCMKINQTGRIN